MTQALSRTKRDLFWALVFAWVAGLATFIYANHKGPTTLNAYPRGSLNAMVEGTADRPFVYRVLIPSVIRALEQPFEGKFTDDQDFKPYGDNDDKAGNRFIRSKTAFRISAQIVITWLCYIGMGFFLASASRSLGRSELLSHLTGLMAIGAIPLWARFYSWSYDPGTVLLCSFMLWSLVKRSLPWFALAFCLASVNKETSVFWLPVLVAVMNHGFGQEGDGKRQPATVWIAAGSLLAFWIAVKWYVKHLYGLNPGSDLENHNLGTNLDIVRHHQFGKLFPLLVYVLYWHFGRYEWARAHLAIKASVLFVGIPLFLGSMTVGNIDEIRALYDILPSLTLLGAPAVFRVMEGFRPEKLSEAL